MYAANSPNNTPGHADVIVRSNVGSFVRITDTIVELDHHPFIIQDGSGLAGPFNEGDNVDACDIIIDGFQCSYSWGVNPDIVSPYKIVDIQGCGANVLRNAIISGPSEDHSGATALVSYHPLPGSNAGYRRLTTDNVHLYNGAIYDVLSNQNDGAAQISWVDLGSSYSDDVSGLGLVRPNLRLSDGMQIFSPGNLRTPTNALAIPTDKPMLATKSRAYVVTYQRPEFQAASTSADVLLEVTPAMTRIKSVVAQETQAWAGAGISTITASVGNTGGGTDPGAVDAYIRPFSLTGAAPVTKGTLPADIGGAYITGAIAIRDQGNGAIKYLSVDNGVLLISDRPPTDEGAYIGGDILNLSPGTGAGGELRVNITTDVNMGTSVDTHLTGGSLTVYATYEEMTPGG
jgi:hypothetical protein